MLKVFSYFASALIVGVLISKIIFSIGEDNNISQTLGDTSVNQNGAEETIAVTDTPVPTNTLTPTPTNTPIPTPTDTPIPTPTNTPTPTPSPTPITAPGILENWFNQYAGQYGVDSQLLKRIAYCESEFNQTAVNGIYVGIFQFNEDIWIRYRQELGHDPNLDLRLDANESIKTAAYLISKGKLFFWPNCH
jgi:hypothetical protein